jgi:hypothetical protein
MWCLPRGGVGCALHEAQGLAVTVGLWHCKVAEDVFFRVPALLLADKHEAHSIDTGKAAHDRRIVQATTVPMHLDKLVTDVVGDVKESGAARVASNLKALGGSEPGVSVLAQLDGPFFQLLDLVADIDAILLRDLPHLHSLETFQALLTPSQMQLFLETCSSACLSALPTRVLLIQIRTYRFTERDGRRGPPAATKTRYRYTHIHTVRMRPCPGPNGLSPRTSRIGRDLCLPWPSPFRAHWPSASPRPHSLWAPGGHPLCFPQRIVVGG